MTFASFGAGEIPPQAFRDVHFVGDFKKIAPANKEKSGDFSRKYPEKRFI